MYCLTFTFFKRIDITLKRWLTNIGWRGSGCIKAIKLANPACGCILFEINTQRR